MSWLLEKLSALFRRMNQAVLPDPSAGDADMAALRKALERQIERDEARHG
ncbi:hypothetical protein [Mesorhizobium sp.]|nr:hypothetical protein [Mesorhizobium sp.]